MTTWPSGNKAVTTTTDADSDSISGSRVDINKTISNVNDIIDIFNIPSSPTDNFILVYDSSTGKFIMESNPSDGTFTNKVVIQTAAGSFTNPPLQITTTNTGYDKSHIKLTDSNNNNVDLLGRNNTGASVYNFQITMDPDNDNGASGITTFAGDYSFNYFKDYSTASTPKMRLAVFGAKGGYQEEVFDDFNNGGGNQYGYKAKTLVASEYNVNPNGGGVTLKVEPTQTTINRIHVSDSNTDIQNTGITRTGDFQVDASGKLTLIADASSPTMEFKKNTTTFLTFEDGPGGDTEMKFSGDAFFVQDTNEENLFAIDTSGSDQGITVHSTDETKSFAITMKRDDNTTGGGAFDTIYAFRVPANDRKIEFEISDSQTTGFTAQTIWSVEDSAGSATGVPTDVWKSHVPFQLKAYASGSMPTDVTAGSIVAVSNNNYKPAYYTGSAWKYVADDSSV